VAGVRVCCRRGCRCRALLIVKVAWLHAFAHATLEGETSCYQVVWLTYEGCCPAAAAPSEIKCGCNLWFVVRQASCLAWC